MIYNESPEIPFGISAYHIFGSTTSGKYSVSEMSLHFNDFPVVGHSAYELKGELNCYPSGIWPGEDGRMAKNFRSSYANYAENRDYRTTSWA